MIRGIRSLLAWCWNEEVSKREGNMDFLYKYLDCDGAEKTLSNMTLRFIPPNDLNDPFECLPAGFHNTSSLRLRNTICAVGDRYGKNGLARMWKYNPWMRLRDMLFVRSADIKKTKEALSQYDGTEFQTDFSSAFGCCSFSETNDNLLMWAHYAKHHHGLVICFRAKSLLHDQIKLTKVHYSKRRVYQKQPTDDKTLARLLSTKSKDWSYEREWRAYKHLSLLEKPESNGQRVCDKLGHSIFTNPIVGSMICSITLGLRFDFDSPLFQTIQGFLANNPGCRLLQAKLKPHHFGIDIEPLSISDCK